MTRDEISQALRLTAMGRTGHPLQEQLAESLAALFEAVGTASTELHADPKAVFEAETRVAETLAALPLKRARAKKAD